MIVHMVLCKNTGRWLKRSAGAGWSKGWQEKQKQGSVWMSKGPASNACKQAIKKNRHADANEVCNPEIVSFTLQPLIPGVNDGTENVVFIAGHTWYYDGECDTWLTGTLDNGIGVFLTSSQRKTWDARVVVEGSMTIINDVNDRNAAMIQAAELWEKLHE